MYRPMPQGDIQEVMVLLNEAPEVNMHLVTVLTRIQHYGEPLNMWGRYKGLALEAVAVYYHGTLIIYEPRHYHYPLLVNLIQHLKPRAITGPGYVITQVANHIGHRRLELTRVSSLKTLNANAHMHLSESPLNQMGRLECIPYSEALLPLKIAFQNRIFAMQVDLNHEGIHQMFATKHMSGYAIRFNDELVAVGEWLNQHPVFGLMIGIGTEESYRRYHLAQYISILLCNDIIMSGKIPLLRYSNEAAGALYHKLGFVDIDSFGTLYLV